MSVDLPAWHSLVEGIVENIADEDLQRRSWFGDGPEVWSPDEAFCQFFDDAGVAEFLDRQDTGLNEKQRAAGHRLVRLMSDLADQLPEHIESEGLFNDPRWQEIRAAAARFRALLQAGDIAA